MKIDGTLDVVPTWGHAPAPDQDQGYVVEVVIPWETFSSTSVPSGEAIRKTVQPPPGTRWRLGLYRLERPRPASLRAASDSILSAAATRRYLGISEAGFAELLAQNRLQPIVAGGDEFRLGTVEWVRAAQDMELQAWTPTYGTSFHETPWFGVIEFVRDE